MEYSCFVNKINMFGDEAEADNPLSVYKKIKDFCSLSQKSLYNFRDSGNVDDAICVEYCKNRKISLDEFFDLDYISTYPEKEKLRAENARLRSIIAEMKAVLSRAEGPPVEQGEGRWEPESLVTVEEQTKNRKKHENKGRHN